MQFSFNGSHFSFIQDEYSLTVKLGNAIIQQQTMQMPMQMVEHQFFGLCQQIAQDNRPMQVKCSRMDWIDDVDKTKPQKQIEKSIEFSNNAYVSEFGEEK